ncbi:MAG: phosphatase PAP2 family protein [Muribaculaceae bacterium]|nr:phosphatase PAP2 family protein [Muribaculaceae bacterium]
MLNITTLRRVACALLFAATFTGLYAQDATATKIKDHRTNPDVFFLQEGDVPNSFLLLPPPPDGASIAFLNDQAMYNWGKLQRDTPRGDQASQDANVEGDGVPMAFSEAFGIDITKDGTPEIYKLVIGMREDAGDLGTRDAKNYYNRTRPFAFYDEMTCNPAQQEELSTNGSYPSGHTSIGWATALVLAEVNPARQNEILKRGYEMGQSRVICGYHFQSDVDAGRITGSATVARLHADPGFQAQLQKAKDEFKRLKKEGKVAAGTPVPTPTTSD